MVPPAQSGTFKEAALFSAGEGQVFKASCNPALQATMVGTVLLRGSVALTLLRRMAVPSALRA